MDELKSALSSDPECGPNFALFLLGKVRKPPVKPHPQHHASKRMKLLIRGHDENLEDLHDAELECQRILLQETLLNSVKPSRHRRPTNPPRPQGTGMSSFCSTSARKEDTDTIVGTSTNFSAVCGTLSTRRQHERRDEDEILGTSMACLGMRISSCPHTLHQLVLHQRHRNVKRRHDLRPVDDLFHGAPLVPAPAA